MEVSYASRSHPLAVATGTPPGILFFWPVITKLVKTLGSRPPLSTPILKAVRMSSGLGRSGQAGR